MFDVIWSLIVCIICFILGSLFFLSYFYYKNDFFEWFVIFAVETALYKTDRRRVFGFALFFWGLALGMGMKFCEDYLTLLK